MNPLILGLGGVVLFFAGLGIGYLAFRRPDDRKAAEELAVVKADFEAYREGVTQHFRDSAGHFQAIGEQYRSLYAHMADGAKHFCAGAGDQEAIEFAPQPELAAPEATSGPEPLTAAAAATALSESPEEPSPDGEAGAEERREPVIAPDTGDTAAAGEEDGDTADLRTDESVASASDDEGSGERELQEPPGDEQVAGPERKEPQSAGSRMVH
jgi:uncharacterized membrane-anchored protein YhcB (DUF1043 family)